METKQIEPIKNAIEDLINHYAKVSLDANEKLQMYQGLRDYVEGIPEGDMCPSDAKDKLEEFENQADTLSGDIRDLLNNW